MQAESICANIEGLDTDTFISVDYLPCDVSPRSRSQDAISIVELGKQLLLSAKNGDTETVRELMCRGAPFTSDWLGTSALHLAAQNNHMETAEILLRAGMSKDARTKVDKTPLHMAAYEGHYDIVQLLLYHGADVDSRDMLRMTPLHWAVEREHIKVMHILLEYGADVGAISKFDKTPVSLALEHNRLDLVDILQREREIITIQAEQQNQASSTEIEVAAQNLMQLEEVEEQQRFETPQQSSSLKRSKFAQHETKPRMIFQRIHVSPSNAGEQEKETENIETIEMNDITNSKKRKTSLGNINKQFRLLEAHGITMIPVEDESSIVENAMESGRTVVLTEAGKLALNSMKHSLNTQSFKIASRRGMVGKVITLKANPILSQNLPTVTSRAPNILKRSAVDNKTAKMRITIPTTTTVHINEANNLISSNENISLTSSTKISQTKLAEPIILQLDDEIEEVTEEDNPDDSEPMDIAILNKQLAEAQRLAAEYFKQYKKKEQEAEIYKQRLKNITAQRASK